MATPLRGVGDGGRDAELGADIDQRHEHVAHAEHEGMVAHVMDARGLGLQRLDDGGQRDDEGLLVDRDHHAVEHGERQRQAHREGGALARARR